VVAPSGRSKAAAAVVVPNQAAKHTDTGIAGPIVWQILKYVLANP
jgi:hypothetical protein